MFNLEKSVESVTYDIVTRMFQQTNQMANALENDYKDNYDYFWDKDRPKVVMQAQVDLLFYTPVQFNGVTINALDMYFNNAWQTLQLLLLNGQDRFFGARNRPTVFSIDDRMIPDRAYPNVPYQKYFTAGWYYDMELDAQNQETGRILVDSPVIWRPDNGEVS